jgi:hypothetical protein
MSWTDDEYNKGKKEACAALLEAYREPAFLVPTVDLQEVRKAVQERRVNPANPQSEAEERGWEEIFVGHLDDLSNLEQRLGDTVPTSEVYRELRQDFADVEDNAEALCELDQLIQNA